MIVDMYGIMLCIGDRVPRRQLLQILRKYCGSVAISLLSNLW